MSVYRELVFAGSRAVVEAFLAGVSQGLAEPLRPCFSELEGVHTEGATELLLEKLHLEAERTHVILPAEQAALVVEAGRRAEPAFTAQSDRRIREAWLDYRFSAYARADAGAIRESLARLPAGVAAEGAEAHEEENPTARGPELYAPLHAYVYAGRGRLRGPFEEILAVRRALIEVPMLEPGEIHLDLAVDVPGGP
jgi:hypothetical protein